MGLYDGIKDVAKIVQQADNIELYRQLLDLSAQALEMQHENEALRAENKRLTDISWLEEKIVRHDISVVALSDDEKKTPYCSRCWDAERKLIQLNMNGTGGFECPNPECKNKGLVRREAVPEYFAKYACKPINRPLLSNGITVI